jgi:paraquat-inducible protein B
MGKRANPTVIGAFIVGALALIVIGLLVFGHGRFFSDTRRFVLYFDGSVKGLNVGAPVDFQGVRVGSVIGVTVQYLPREGEFRTPVYIEVEPGSIKEMGTRTDEDDQKRFLQSLVDRGLRARLESQSLVTGQLFVELGFFPDTPIRLVGGDLDIPELPTIPTTLQQAQAAAQSVLEKLQELPLDQLFAHVMQTIQGIDRLVNSPELPELVRSLNAAQADILRLVRQVETAIPPLLDEARTTSTVARTLLTDLQQLVRRVDGQVVPLADSTKQTLDTARAVLKDSQQLVRNADGRVTRLTDGFTDAAKAAQATMASAQRRIDDNLVLTLQEMTAAVRSIRVLMDYLERNPNALLTGKGGDRR